MDMTNAVYWSLYFLPFVRYFQKFLSFTYFFPDWSVLTVFLSCFWSLAIFILSIPCQIILTILKSISTYLTPKRLPLYSR
jgi:hypothetical protein